MRPDITIASATIDSPAWAELLVRSVRMFTKLDYEIVIIDNGSLDENVRWLQAQPDVRLIRMGMNIGHGGALDTSVLRANADYVCFLDIDAHVQRDDWELDLMADYNSEPKIRLIGCKGTEEKPLRPPLFFFERDFFYRHKYSFRHIPGVSTDTAQAVFGNLKKDGFDVMRYPIGKKIYPAGRGDEIWVGGKPTFYHHWYGTRFNEHNPSKMKGKLDGIDLAEHLRRKAELFSEPLVEEIMSSTIGGAK